MSIEVSLYGITESNSLVIKDFWIPYQFGTAVTTEFDEEKKVEEVDKLIQKGLDPNNFLKIWVHTHPKMSPNPSGTDIQTFKTKFNNLNWSIRLILGQNKQMTVKYQQNSPIPLELDLKTEIDFSNFKGFGIEEQTALLLELAEKVQKPIASISKFNHDNNFDYLIEDKYRRNFKDFDIDDWRDRYYDNKGIHISNVEEIETEDTRLFESDYFNCLESKKINSKINDNQKNSNFNYKKLIPFKGLNRKKK
jgi:proteasome lid subunit RPN8/RPN11